MVASWQHAPRYSQGIAFYDLNTLLDPGTPSTGFIGSLPDAYDCAFSPDLSQLVTYYNPRFSDSRGIVVFNLSDLDDLDNTLNAEQVVNLSQLFISSRLGITDVEWLPGNTIFTTGDLLKLRTRVVLNAYDQCGCDRYVSLVINDEVINENVINDKPRPPRIKLREDEA